MILPNLQSLRRRASGLPVTRHPSRLSLRTFLAVFCACFALLAARAQDTNIPPLQYSTAPTLSPAVETNLPPLVAPEYVPEAMPAPPLTGTRQLYVPSAVPQPSLAPLLRSGPLAVQPHLFYSLSYGNGIEASPGQLNSSLVNEFDPGVLLRWGDHWSLDYTPIFRFYSSSAFRNTFDNAVSLTGGTTYEAWTFGLSQSYTSSSDPIVETGAQTDQQTLSTLLSAEYRLGSKTSLEFSASQAFRLLGQSTAAEQQQLNNYNSWSTMDWLNYKFWPGLSAGIGAGFTYNNVSLGPDSTLEQIQGRITWVVLKKLSFVLSAGGQDMQFLGSGAPNLISPTYSLSVQYSPFDTTTVSVSGYSGVTPSYFQDQVTESTFISAGFHQRLLSKLALDLSGGYSTATYHSSTSVSSAANLGSYDSMFFSAGLSAPILKRGTASIFYSANFNSSGAAAYNYTTTMVGFSLSYRY